MNNQGFKIECKVHPVVDGKLTPGFDGLAHIVPVKYDELFTAVFGSVMVACTDTELHQLRTAGQTSLHLCDGRLLGVRFVSASMGRAAVIGDQVVSEEWNQIHFVALTELMPPPHGSDQH